MEICSIGFTTRSAESFFTALGKAGVEKVIDVRLNNRSQLAGFTKRDDLAYFLQQLLGASYVHEPLLAPTKALLDGYRKEKRGWDWYEANFIALMEEREIHRQIPRELFEPKSALLCSEFAPNKCHRRLVIDFLASKWDGVVPAHIE